MVITSFHDLDRKAKRLYKSHNPLNLDFAYKISQQGIFGLDTIHIIGTTCGKTEIIINNVVGSRRINIFGQPFIGSVKCSGAEIARWLTMKTSASLRAKNSFSPTRNTMIHMDSSISLASNSTKLNGATIFQLFTDASRSSSWCLGGQFSFRSRLKTILCLSYLSPNINMITRAYLLNFHEEIISSISYRFTDKLKSGLTVSMVENNSPLVGFGVKYKFNETFCFTAKVNDLGRTAFGFKYCHGPNFSFSLSLAP